MKEELRPSNLYNTIDLCIKYRKTLFGKGERRKLNIVLFAMTKSGVKNVDLRRNEIRSMQCSWIERLFEDDFHDLKVIPTIFNKVEQ